VRSSNDQEARVTDDLMHAVHEIREHADDYLLARDYFDGSVSEVFVSPVVRRALRGGVCGFDINLAKRPVTAVLDRMRISAVSVPGDETATRRLVDTIWNPNRLGRVSKRIHWSALTHGDAYAIVWPGDDESSVEVHYNSPVTTRVFYSEDNDREKAYAAKLWGEGRGDQRRFRCDLYYADRVESYATAVGSKGEQRAEWREYTADEGGPWPIPNPYGVVPVFHFRTGEPYGRPVHADAFGPQNAITKLSATLMATIDFQGFPQRYALLNPMDSAAASSVDWDDDETSTPDADGRAMEVGPGRILQLDAKGVGQFDPANVEAFLRPLNFYARAMSAATATPLRFLEPSGQVPSGESLRADDAPLVQRILDHEELIGDEWADLLVFAAQVAGEPVARPDVQWAPVQTVDDLAGWQTVKAKQEAGVPARQALTEAGYTSELVQRWLEGSQEPNIDTRIDALTRIGQAMNQLGSAVNSGVMSTDQVDQILQQTLADLVRDPQ
jgi:hypothetical protein